MQNEATHQIHSLLPTFIIQYKRKIETLSCTFMAQMFVVLLLQQLINKMRLTGPSSLLKKTEGVKGREERVKNFPHL